MAARGRALACMRGQALGGPELWMGPRGLGLWSGGMGCEPEERAQMIGKQMDTGIPLHYASKH